MFQISALPASRFIHLYGLSDRDLSSRGIVVMTADSNPGFPCRVSLRDADLGARMLLLNYEHQDAPTPYRSRHAIFVSDGAREAAPDPGEVPEQMRRRLLSVRAFSAEGMILNADVVEGARAGDLFEAMLSGKRVAYLHAHFAKFGCYAARIDRAF